MAFTDPTTVTAGTVLTATRYNEDVVANWNMFGAAWTSWTPTLGGGFANGNATTAGGYLKIGRAVWYWGTITFGSTTTKGAVMTVSLPATATSAEAGAAICSIYGNPAGNQVLFTPLASSTTAVEVVTMNVAGTYLAAAQTNATVPYTWATGNIVRYGGVFEAAS